MCYGDVTPTIQSFDGQKRLTLTAKGDTGIFASFPAYADVIFGTGSCCSCAFSHLFGPAVSLAPCCHSTGSKCRERIDYEKFKLVAGNLPACAVSGRISTADLEVLWLGAYQRRRRPRWLQCRGCPFGSTIGSRLALTTLVLKSPVTVSAEQIDQFEKKYSHNVRPTQPLNDRVVIESK